MKRIIMVVDSDPNYLTKIRDALFAVGHEVRVFEDPETALRHIRAGGVAYDLLLVEEKAPFEVLDDDARFNDLPIAVGLKKNPLPHLLHDLPELVEGFIRAAAQPPISDRRRLQ